MWLYQSFRVKDGLLSVICGDENCSRRVTVRLGIDTSIANSLVYFSSVHKIFDVPGPIFAKSLLQSPAYRYSDSGRLLYFGRVITAARDRDSDSEDLYFGLVVYLFFSVHQIFDVPGPIFAKLCHTTRYALK